MKDEDHIHTEYLDINVNFKLRKDMQEGEEICKECGGLGLRLVDNRYGLSIDGKKLGNEMFPFKKEAVVWCDNCFTGVSKRCLNCNELIPKSYTKCQKERCKELRGEALWQKKLEGWNKTTKISYNEALERYSMLYIDDWDRYVEPDDLAAEIQYQLDENEDLTLSDIANLRIYTTYTTSAFFDAESIMENACDELHEEASERAWHIIPKLQEQLDKIAKEIEHDTTTYYPDDIGVLLTVGDIEEFGLKFS